MTGLAAPMAGDGVRGEPMTEAHREALRAAAEPMLKDPKFREEAARVMGEGVQAFPGERVGTVLRDYLNSPAALRAHLRDLVESGKSARK